MKHLKIFEDFDEEFEIGEYVIVIRAYRSVNIENGDRCKIVKYSDFSDGYYTIENEYGVQEEYRKDRFISELKYNRNKFNI